MRMRGVCAVIGAIVTGAMLTTAAYAATESTAQKLDHRVHLVPYQKDQVFKFLGHYRFQSSIELEENEAIQTISLGDSTAWLINPLGNRIFLKPIEPDATTNMTLITNKRTYLFELHSRETDDIGDPEMIFIMRFLYSDSDNTAGFDQYTDEVGVPDIDKHPENYNFNYTISGNQEISPIRIFDDGEFTYFEFKDKNADIPGFFMVDENNEESLINYRTRGNYIVVERVSSRYTLRLGNKIVCVFNEARIAQMNAMQRNIPQAPSGQAIPAAMPLQRPAQPN